MTATEAPTSPKTCRAAAHIEIVLLFLETNADIQVHDNANARRQKHDQWLNGFRMLKALHRLIENPEGNKDKCQCINEGRKYPDAVVAKSLVGIGRFFGLSSRELGKAKCKNVGEHMPGIREQRQRV